MYYHWSSHISPSMYYHWSSHISPPVRVCITIGPLIYPAPVRVCITTGPLIYPRVCITTGPLIYPRVCNTTGPLIYPRICITTGPLIYPRLSAQIAMVVQTCSIYLTVCVTLERYVVSIILNVQYITHMYINIYSSS